ncbi:START domain-containing protein [Pseudoalteromonas sp. H105]|uniref:START domain-containing protein n=1 Tax=Pseudoalteromonas sp. H105 TaxID=1348393 RepID=UPI0009EBF8A9|nr:START domain-containing protein [Pseudoalteromonas sp. H105]
MRKLIALLLMLLCCTEVTAQQSQWQLWKSQEGISVSFIKHTNGIFEVQGTLSINDRTADDFMMLLSDTQRAPLWVENVTHVEVLSRPSDAETIVYTKINSPWPVRDRDMVSYSCYKQLSPTQTLLTISAYPGFKNEVDSVVRIKDLKATWLLEENNTPGKVSLTLTHTVYADPGGAIPHWLSNKVGLQSTLKTLQALRRELAQERYRAAPTVIKEGHCSI